MSYSFFFFFHDFVTIYHCKSMVHFTRLRLCLFGYNDIGLLFFHSLPNHPTALCLILFPSLQLTTFPSPPLHRPLLLLVFLLSSQKKVIASLLFWWSWQLCNWHRVLLLPLLQFHFILRILPHIAIVVVVVPNDWQRKTKEEICFYNCVCMVVV